MVKNQRARSRPDFRRVGGLEVQGNFFPGAFAARGADRLDQRLDAHSGAEIERLQPASGESVKKARDLNRLQVVEAELATRRDTEEAVEGMMRASLDAAEP